MHNSVHLQSAEHSLAIQMSNHLERWLLRMQKPSYHCFRISKIKRLSTYLQRTQEAIKAFATLPPLLSMELISDLDMILVHMLQLNNPVIIFGFRIREFIKEFINTNFKKFCFHAQGKHLKQPFPNSVCSIINVTQYFEEFQIQKKFFNDERVILRVFTFCTI